VNLDHVWGILGWDVVMGAGQKFLTWDRSIFFALVGMGQPSLVWIWVWKISDKNPKFFSFSPSDPKKYLWGMSKSTSIKDGSVSYLLRVKSMLGLGHGSTLGMCARKHFGTVSIQSVYY